MIKQFKSTLLILLAVVLIVSCKKNNEVVDQGTVSGTLAVRFTDVPNASAPYYKRIPVKADPTTNGVWVDVSLSKYNTVDTKVDFTFTSATAPFGINYTSPTSLSIKSTNFSGKFKVVGDYAHYSDSTVIDTVKVKIIKGQASGLLGKDSMFLIFQKFCPINITDYNTTYANSIVFGATDKDTVAPAEIYTIDSLGIIPQPTPTTAIGYIYDLYPGGSGGLTPDPLKVTFDWTDETSLKVIFEDQYFYTNGAGLPRNCRPTSGKISTFNSCTHTIDLYMDVYYPVTGAVVASGRHIQITL